MSSNSVAVQPATPTRRAFDFTAISTVQSLSGVAIIAVLVWGAIALTVSASL